MNKGIKYIKLGTSAKRILVMSPVMPEWDNGEFFQPLTDYFLDNGYSLLIVDTLSLTIQANEPITHFSQRWVNELESYGPFDIIAGSALGGAVAQLIASCERPTKTSDLLLISAPNYADSELQERLGVMAELARAGDLDQAMKVLAYRVLPETCQPMERLSPIRISGSAQQWERLSIGFGYLFELDIRSNLKGYQGRVLNVLGERSQLVRLCNTRFDASLTHLTILIPGGGMRPLLDNAPLVISAIEEHLLYWEKTHCERT